MHPLTCITLSVVWSHRSAGAEGGSQGFSDTRGLDLQEEGLLQPHPFVTSGLAGICDAHSPDRLLYVRQWGKDVADTIAAIRSQLGNDSNSLAADPGCFGLCNFHKYDGNESP